MKYLLYSFMLCCFLACSNGADETNADTNVSMDAPDYAMVMHGGAGTILKKNMTPEREKSYRMAIDSSLTIGENILKNGGSALDAVVETIKYLEDNPLFNAGKGAVFTNKGINELDASIMNGADQNAGAVGGISVVRHPIEAAKAVMQQSEHVFLVGKGAEEFATRQGLEIVDPKYFYSDRRWKSLQRIKDKEMTELDHDEKKHGTVGVVALDKNGNIVAGTSTGGMTNKRFNRIGDSPVIGAGTYANNATCGVSCTGHGEYFIRYAIAHAMSSMMEFGGKSVQEAGDYLVHDLLVKKKGTGGLVALDKYGHITMPFNTAGMYRGYVKPDERVVKIYND